MNIDEYFNRAEFEADLRIMISRNKAERRQLVQALLARKRKQMSTGRFTLKKLAGGETQR